MTKVFLGYTQEGKSNLMKIACAAENVSLSLLFFAFS